MKKGYIQKRGAHASRKKFLNALAKILRAEPADYDRLPEIENKSLSKDKAGRRHANTKPAKDFHE